MTAMMSGLLTVEGDQMKMMQLIVIEPALQAAWVAAGASTESSCTAATMEITSSQPADIKTAPKSGEKGEKKHDEQDELILIHPPITPEGGLEDATE